MSNPSPTISLTKEAIRQWLQDPDQWPNDSYDLATLQPSDTQLRREEGLRKILPAWCWTGEPGAAMLTIGTGKAYLERKYWNNFDRLYVIDPSEQTRAALEFFPQPNVQYLGASLFNQGVHHQPVAKYAWFGASIHYLFGEFHGWEFMHKLAMMVSDTVVVDAGVFDADTRHGKVFLESWQGDEAFEIHRRAQFSYEAFRETIAGIWDISGEWPTPWIDGRRTLVLKRILPPVVQKSSLRDLKTVKTTPYWTVQRTASGYFKETSDLAQLLIYDTVAKVMGWKDFVSARVFDGARYCGFITRDLGELTPTEASASERMQLNLSSWLLPLGLLPADVARQNLRLTGGQTIWMDIDLREISSLTARDAMWMATNLYKQYDALPAGLQGVSRRIGSGPGKVVRPQWHRPPAVAAEQGWRELLLRLSEVVAVAVPEGATVLVVSKGDEELLQLDGRRAWHFPRNAAGAYAGFHPQDDAQAMTLLNEAMAAGAGFLLFPNTAFWWFDNYPRLRQELEAAHHRLFSDESCVIYRLKPNALPTKN